ncbi:MAG: hypothetical protein IJ783_05190 [Kiritimatiellae bacterium]|nr:hypothetical protein [Kiritimatiellia bacterium]
MNKTVTMIAAAAFCAAVTPAVLADEAEAAAEEAVEAVAEAAAEEAAPAAEAAAEEVKEEADEAAEAAEAAEEAAPAAEEEEAEPADTMDIADLERAIEDSTYEYAPVPTTPSGLEVWTGDITDPGAAEAVPARRPSKASKKTPTTQPDATPHGNL